MQEKDGREDCIWQNTVCSGYMRFEIKKTACYVSITSCFFERQFLASLLPGLNLSKVPVLAPYACPYRLFCNPPATAFDFAAYFLIPPLDPKGVLTV